MMSGALPASELDLSLDTPFGIGEVSFEKIVADIERLRPKAIVEFGAGVSSFRLAYAFPSCEVWSIDHDAVCHERDVAALSSLARPASNLQLRLRPVQRQRFGWYLYKSYAVGDFPPIVDAVIVDGPPNWFCRAREACLHQVASALRAGSRIYLDDAHRDAESRMSANWLLAYPALKRVAVIEGGHGVNVFEVTAPLSRPRWHPAVLCDHLIARLAERHDSVSARFRKRSRGVMRV